MRVNCRSIVGFRSSGYDFDLVIHLIYDLHGEVKVANAYQRYMEARAEQLVEQYWELIEQLLRTQQQPLQTAYQLISGLRACSAASCTRRRCCPVSMTAASTCCGSAPAPRLPQQVSIIDQLNKALGGLTEGVAAAICETRESRSWRNIDVE